MTDDTPLPFDLPSVHRKKLTVDFEGGNLTGFTQFTAALEPKRLDLLRELVV